MKNLAAVFAGLVVGSLLRGINPAVEKIDLFVGSLAAYGLVWVFISLYPPKK